MMTKAEIEAMSIDDRAKLAEMLWDSMPEERIVEIPEWQAKILEERLADFLANPQDLIPWEKVKADLKSRKKHA